MQSQLIKYFRNPLPDAEVSYWSLKTKPAASASKPAPRPRRANPRQPSPSSQQHQAEAQAITQYLRDDSRSARLEQLINRQRSRQCKFDWLEQPQATLEHLAVARRPDQRYQLINRSTKKPLTRHPFETAEHCAEAAAELERTFELSGMLALDAGEGLEHIDAIILATVAREQVALLWRIRGRWVEGKCSQNTIQAKVYTHIFRAYSTLHSPPNPPELGGWGTSTRY